VLQAVLLALPVHMAAQMVALRAWPALLAVLLAWPVPRVALLAWLVRTVELVELLVQEEKHSDMHPRLVPLVLVRLVGMEVAMDWPPVLVGPPVLAAQMAALQAWPALLLAVLLAWPVPLVLVRLVGMEVAMDWPPVLVGPPVLAVQIAALQAWPALLLAVLLAWPVPRVALLAWLERLVELVEPLLVLPGKA